MPINVNGTEERDRIATEVARLQKQANHHIGERAIYSLNPNFIFNPQPGTWWVQWSNQEKVLRRKNQGYDVVTAERAEEFYKIPSHEIDHTNNRATRNGQTLMECPLAVHAKVKAEPVLVAVKNQDKDIKAFADAIGNAGREVDHGRGIVKRRKMGQLSEEELTQIRAKKLHDQIQQDMARRTVAASQKSLEQEVKFNPGFFTSPTTIIDHGGFREVVLTDDPNRDLEDFE